MRLLSSRSPNPRPTTAPSACGTLPRYADTIGNELGITVPIAVHADHFGLKKPPEVAKAKVDIPSMFDAGITSIAIDASHMVDDENLLANLDLKALHTLLGRL